MVKNEFRTFSEKTTGKKFRQHFCQIVIWIFRIELIFNL